MEIMLGKNLRTLRMQSKRTLENVAEIIEVSRQSISKWEAGESYPDIEKCVKLAKLYNVSVDALINESIEELQRKNSLDGKYVFGLTRVNENGAMKLPKKALDVFEITTEDTLLVIGDTSQGIAIVKCGGANSFIDEN